MYNNNNNNKSYYRCEETEIMFVPLARSSAKLASQPMLNDLIIVPLIYFLLRFFVAALYRTTDTQQAEYSGSLKARFFS